MKIVLGVGEPERMIPLIDLLQALRFRDARLEAVRIFEPAHAASLGALEHNFSIPLAALNQARRGDEEKLLDRIAGEISSRGFASCESRFLDGFHANTLIKHAEESEADLLGIASSGMGPSESFLMGSVTRKATISARCSLLISKKPVEPKRRLSVVIATDHSDYANRCIDAFVGWAPGGIGRLVVTTVYATELIGAIAAASAHQKDGLAGELRRDLEGKNADVTGRLRELKAETSSRIENGRVSDVLARVMAEEAADLLVLGAQGHGFFERMLLGSVALEQTIGKPYSVLVVRVPEAKRLA